jgi:K+-transporting ATPase A subunit
LDSNPALVRHRRRVGGASRRLHGARVQRRAHVSFADPAAGRSGLYWLGGVADRREQYWITYTVSMLFFRVSGFLILYALMRLQAGLPFNPAEQSAVA